jgi:hypothetical protein
MSGVRGDGGSGGVVCVLGGVDRVQCEGGEGMAGCEEAYGGWEIRRWRWIGDGLMGEGMLIGVMSTNGCVGRQG